MAIQNVSNYSDSKSISKINESSFDKNGQFKGTSWNKTAYVQNDENQSVIFEPDKDMQIKLNSRYYSGREAIFKNLDKKHTGISFDLLDKFIDAAKDGILEDVDHNGYTQINMKNFGKAFSQIQHNKLESKKYTNLKDKTLFVFTAEELKKLYEAAGFALNDKQNPSSQKSKEVSNNNNQNNNSYNESNKNYIDEIDVSVPDSNNNNMGKIEVNVPDSSDNNKSKIEVNVPSSNDNYRYKIDEDGNLYYKKSGFFNRIFSKFKKVDNQNPDLKNEKAQNLNLDNSERTESLLDNAIKKFENGEDVVAPVIAYYDEEGEQKSTNYAKLVKLKNGGYAFKDISFMGRSKNIYYQPTEKVAIGKNKATLVTGITLDNVEEAK